MFSPYYAWSGWRDPYDHCAVNVVLHGPAGNRWTMTERQKSALQRDARTLSIGPSQLTWDGSHLTVRLDEFGAPLPHRLRGTVRVTPAFVTEQAFTLDQAGRHSWWPIAPKARVEVELDRPDCCWQGHGYFDTNSGTEPLEDGFLHWTWSRADHADGSVILYDALRRDHDRQTLALQVTPSGRIEAFPPPPTVDLPRTTWRVARSTQADAGHTPTVRRTLVDAPFYARSVLSTQVLGAPLTAVHESLDLTRFARFWVRCLLPFRMPRLPR